MLPYMSAVLAGILGTTIASAHAADSAPFLQGLKHQALLTSTVPDNGDQNPYAIVVAPASSGSIQKGDVLVDNFNNSQNLQGTGTTIMDYSPTTQKTSIFAEIPRQLSQCPGGVGLSTAMTMLQSGWVIVGSVPSNDGTTATKGQGCLIVLDSRGQVAEVFSNAEINGPWGNMAVIDHGGTASIFISNSGFGLGAPTENSPVVAKATVLRIDLNIPEGPEGPEGPESKPPVIIAQTVIADSLSEQADASVFLIGPTGLALGANDTLYVSDAINNRIVSIPQASTRTTSASSGHEITRNGLLQRPLALAMTPNGHLLATNGLNGQVVEIDPMTGQQLDSLWIDNDKAQAPPGSGDLFGIAMMPSGDGFYYVEDDMNTLMEATHP
ncbi:MAG: hypothetical protein P4M08_00085 [Oligoflexia bacterium]|nr:hypothetical protein [Oligoflexia bacterium]